MTLSYDATLQHRGGQVVVSLPWTNITWGRVLDDVSSASVTVPITSPSHPKAWAVSDRLAWEFELAIWRKGEMVWVGPVLEPQWSDEGITIPARDLMEWFERRTLPTDHDFKGVDLATIFETFATDANNTDPIPGLVIASTPTGIDGDRKVLAAEHRIAADLLREIARDGLDFTVIGRTIMTGGVEIPVATLQRLNNFWLKNPKIKEAGLLRATEATVVGSAPAGSSSSIVGMWGGKNSVSPPVLIQRVFNETQVTDAVSATAAAHTRWDEIALSPEYVTGDVDLERGPSVNALIPGAKAACDLRAGCRLIGDTVRLSSVSANVSAGDQGITETVTAEFIPLGTGEAI